MVCILCGREQKWDPVIESLLWTAIEIRREKFYGCPFCVPRQTPADRAKFESAVSAALVKMGAHI
jgi:hypothetical protein